MKVDPTPMIEPNIRNTPVTAEHADTNDRFLIVTERGGEPVSAAQLERFYQRYIWAGAFCQGKDVLEVACGTGPGLGYLHSVSRSLRAGDVSAKVLEAARAQYGERICLDRFDATSAPYADGSFDVILLFEAIYYLPDVRAFLREVGRLLRPDGVLLLATANKDLFDFNPSSFSRNYFNAPELSSLLGEFGFVTQFLGGSTVSPHGLGSLGLRAAKRVAVDLGLMPKSMNGKRLLKRLVFGKLVHMPLELDARNVPYVPPVPIPANSRDLTHQVLYCVAGKGSS